MNSSKEIISVLVIAVIGCSFIIGFLISRDFNVEITNDKVSITKKNIAQVITESKINQEDTNDATLQKYEVKKGDTLENIAKLFNVSKTSILMENNLKTENITMGEIILIPSQKTK